LIKKRL